MTELHDLICQNDYDKLEEEIKKGKYDVNARDEEWGYRHGLHWAAHKGFSECIRLLVEFGAWPYARDYRGWTAGHYAAEMGKLPACRALFLAKCPLHLKDKWGLTPADVAMVYGHKECALFLRQCESEIEEKRIEFNRQKRKLASSSSKSAGSRKSKPDTASSRASTVTDDSSSVKDAPKEDDVFEFDRDDPNWKTFFNLEWGNPEFEGAVSNVYIPYLMGGA